MTAERAADSRLRAAAWMLSSVLLACRDDGNAGVELERICDRDGPVALLELQPNETVWQVHRFDDERLRVLVGPVEDDDELLPRSLLVAECGGVPEPVAPNMEWVFRYEGVLLGCDRDGALVLPRGIDDPAPLVLAQRGCATRATNYGLLAY